MVAHPSTLLPHIGVDSTRGVAMAVESSATSGSQPSNNTYPRALPKDPLQIDWRPCPPSA